MQVQTAQVHGSAVAAIETRRWITAESRSASDSNVENEKNLKITK
jgi:hypothetical protein